MRRHDTDSPQFWFVSSLRSWRKSLGIRLISLQPSPGGKFIVLRTAKALRFAGGVQIEWIVPLRRAPGIKILDGRSYACDGALKDADSFPRNWSFQWSLSHSLLLRFISTRMPPRSSPRSQRPAGR